MKKRVRKSRVALGFRAHSGWAAAVAVAGGPRAPAVLDRRRLELMDRARGGMKQPYHAAENMDLQTAKKLISRSRTQAQELALRGLRAMIRDLRSKGHEVVGSGVALASGRPLPNLAATLASHALIHAAEGELFRNALIHASQRCGVPVRGIKERELYARGAAELRCPQAELRRRIAAVSKTVGPPWSEDQKLAALIGWLALAGARRQKPRAGKGPS